MDLKKLGKKIKVARVEQDLNQTQFAHKIGANQKSVSLYENGIAEPSLSTMDKIAKVLKKPVDHFLQ
jgi:DNA-binding XRE family transcriptional regulator